MAALRCTNPFVAYLDGVPRLVTGGELVDANDPVVQGRDQFFEPVDDYLSRRGTKAAPTVEQATAAPGERRSRGKATKATQSPAAKTTPTTTPAKGSQDADGGSQDSAHGTKGKD